MKYKPIPIGVEDFKRLIDDGYYFIDKTLMIKELIDRKGAVNLFARPRRFGKTLNMSMIQRFFEKSHKDNGYLFENLNISKCSGEYMKYQGKYPVIMLSLKSMGQPSYKLSFSLFKQIINREFGRHKEVLQSDDVLPSDKKLFEEIFNSTAEDSAYVNAIRLLSDCLYAVYGKNVIILIDEYDVPLENSYFKGFYDEMADLIRSVFESALKTNPYLEFGILTGCLRVSKESIFTGLNNLNVNSLNTLPFSDCFGFTEQEVLQMTKDFGIENRFTEVKEWYDGYIFGKTEIYNPWSVISYVADASQDSSSLPKTYWSNTSSNEILHELVIKGHEDTHMLIESLVNGATITKPVFEDITYKNIDINSDHIWSFLLFTGYLKPVSMYLENDIIYADMVIPNKEIKSIYRRTIMQWFKEKVRAEGTDKLFDAVISGDVQAFEDEVNNWLLQCISYHDNYENYYHGFLMGLLLGRIGYKVLSNRENGKGRSDITICEFQKRTIAVIIEVKSAEDYNSLDKMCDKALEQIENKQYEADFLKQSYKKVLKYGISFCSDKVCRVKLGGDKVV